MNYADSTQDEQHCKTVYANCVCFDVAKVFVVVVCLFICFCFLLIFALTWVWNVHASIEKGRSKTPVLILLLLLNHNFKTLLHKDEKQVTKSLKQTANCRLAAPEKIRCKYSAQFWPSCNWWMMIIVISYRDANTIILHTSILNHFTAPACKICRPKTAYMYSCEHNICLVL